MLNCDRASRKLSNQKKIASCFSPCVLAVSAKLSASGAKSQQTELYFLPSLRGSVGVKIEW